MTSLSGQDLSGLAFDPTDANVLYAVKNKSHVYRLLRSGGTWVKDTANGWTDGKDLRFPGNTGLPDSEGLTVGPDGALYITTERDNAASGVPLDSILKFDPTSSDTTLVASDQWVLTVGSRVHERGRQPGLRGRRLRARQLPDARPGSAPTTERSTTPRPTRARRSPDCSSAPSRRPGTCVPTSSTPTTPSSRVADIATGMVGVMDASYDADLGRIWAHCDNTCGNATTLLEIGSDGHFVVDHDVQHPHGPAQLQPRGLRRGAGLDRQSTAPARCCGPTTATASATRCGAARSTSTSASPSRRRRPRPSSARRCSATS